MDYASYKLCCWSRCVRSDHLYCSLYSVDGFEQPRRLSQKPVYEIHNTTSTVTIRVAGMCLSVVTILPTLVLLLCSFLLLYLRSDNCRHIQLNLLPSLSYLRPIKRNTRPARRGDPPNPARRPGASARAGVRLHPALGRGLGVLLREPGFSQHEPAAASSCRQQR